jgi:hypothetical protein
MELGYKPERIEIEKEFPARRKPITTLRIAVIFMIFQDYREAL